MDLCVEMAEDENIYYFDKPEEPQEGWQSVVNYEDANGEVSQYENDEHYETAIEDESQYYSVIEDQTITDNAKPELDPNEQALQQLEYELGYTNADLSAIAYPGETQDVPVSKPESKESEDQVILYKIEDSNELFAVQIARDADGNVQKYQYKVRQNEDGQLEAVPGTIRIQEGEEILSEVEEKPIPEPEIPIQSDLEVQDPLQNQILETQPESYPEIQSEFIPEPNDIVNQALQNAEFNPEYPEEGYYDENASYVNGDTETGQQFYGEDEFTNVEFLMDEEEGNKSQRKEFKKIKPKQILNKLNASIHNDSIELKRIPEKHSSNKLTFLIVTHPVPDNQNPPPRPQFTQLQNNKFVYSIPGILNSINSGQTHIKRFNRSILRPALKQTKTVVRPVLQQAKSILQQTKPKFVQQKPLLKFNSQLKKIEVIKTKVTEEPKGPRQPRKQVITPVDRVGSEIIIQAPEEKPEFVETYDLDELSDDDYTPRYKKIRTPKKKKLGRKPKPPAPIDPNAPTPPSLIDDSQTTITKYNGNVIQKKRGPGRPRLNHNKNFTYIQKEVIMQQDTKSPGRGRPKFIRTQQNNPNSVQPPLKSEIKENVVVPRKRGRPPKRKVGAKVVKTDEMDRLMNRMEDIHGGEEDDEEDMIIERLEDDEEDQSLLSILETPVNNGVEELEEGEVRKEDILTMSLKEANIIESTDDIPKDVPQNDVNNIKEKPQITIIDQTIIIPEPPKAEPSYQVIKPKREIYKCSLCPKTFSKQLLLKSHKMESHNKTIKKPNNFQCSSCSRIFFSEKTLQFHVTLKHAKKASEKPIEHTCTVCPKTFKLLSELTRHQLTHKKLSCSNCGQIFTSQQLLNQHMRLHCLKVPKSPKSPLTKLLNCEKCPKKFANKVFLSNHMQREHLSPAKKRMSCALPRRSGILELKRQIKFTARKKAKCEKCNIEFATPFDLEEHNKKHIGLSFKCSLRNVKLETKLLLDKHVETHAEEKSTDNSKPDEVQAQMLSAIQQLKIDRRKIPHGGIPITLKMRRKTVGTSLL